MLPERNLGGVVQGEDGGSGIANLGIVLRNEEFGCRVELVSVLTGAKGESGWCVLERGQRGPKRGRQGGQACC